jgi:hypothetical protein
MTQVICYFATKFNEKSVNLKWLSLLWSLPSSLYATQK